MTLGHFDGAGGYLGQSRGRLAGSHEADFQIGEGALDVDAVTQRLELGRDVGIGGGSQGDPGAGARASGAHRMVSPWEMPLRAGLQQPPDTDANGEGEHGDCRD